MKGGEKVKKFRRIALSLVLAVALMASFVVPVAADNPTVSITVTAEVIAITNTQDTWGIGTVTTDAVVYFSTDGTQNDTYSQVENTGTVAVDVQIQGMDLAGTPTWTLASTTSADQYTLFANSEATPTVYDVEVKSSAYGDLTTNLAKADTYDWSMKFTAPSSFGGTEDGTEKSGTVTLVASKYVA